MTNGNGPDRDQERLTAVAQALAQEPVNESIDAMRRIEHIASVIRAAATGVADQQSRATRKLNELADDIEGEARQRLGDIIREGHTFWASLERRLLGQELTMKS